MSLCEVPKCAGEMHAGGLCLKHYMRVRRHGSVTGGRNGDGRIKSSHPLWEGWKSMRRAARGAGGCDPSWSDFWKFVADVGPAPESGGRLYRVNRALPYGPGNVEWKTPIIDVPQLEDKALYQRAWRLKRPHLARENNLKKNYGITLERYNEMLAAQNGLCAICRGPEKAVDPRSGRPYALAVDHCAVTGALRGLCCTGCNTGIGCFNHDPLRLQAAIEYLSRHASIRSDG